LAPALGAASALALSLVLAHEGWRAHRVQQLRDMAFDLNWSPDPARPERKVACLEEAARLVPEDALLQSELAFEHLNAFDRRMAELARRGPDATEEGRLRREHVVPALRLFLLSRDLSPLRAEIHMILANHVDEFVAAEPRGAYLERAKLLAPADPDLWYRCGLHELEDGRPDRAWTSWRRSLELSDGDLPEVLDRSVAALGPRDTLRRVLPDQPGLLLAAAVHLYPRPDEGRRLFQERALAILEGRPGPPSAEELHTRATIHRALGRPAEALKVYRQALLRQPDQIGWRHELAELACAQGRFEEAHQELLTILALQPGNAQARTLLDVAARGLAEHR
jgi:tetratricopeptide (TPR) repeat protein